MKCSPQQSIGLQTGRPCRIHGCCWSCWSWCCCCWCRWWLPSGSPPLVLPQTEMEAGYRGTCLWVRAMQRRISRGQSECPRPALKRLLSRAAQWRWGWVRPQEGDSGGRQAEGGDALRSKFLGARWRGGQTKSWVRGRVLLGWREGVPKPQFSKLNEPGELQRHPSQGVWQRSCWLWRGARWRLPGTNRRASGCYREAASTPPPPGHSWCSWHPRHPQTRQILSVSLFAKDCALTKTVSWSNDGPSLLADRVIQFSFGLVLRREERN